MQCTKPIYVQGRYFPCGKCLNCRIANSREWAARLMQELSYWNDATFVTLTYAPRSLPADKGLHVDELQKFFKRLRKRFVTAGKVIETPCPLNENKMRKSAALKYFACGEYGDNQIFSDTGLGRPHYHAIIFGLSRSKEDKEMVKDSWRFADWDYLSDKKAFGSVTYDSCRYVSDYIFKKYSGKKKDEVYGDLQPPFRILSGGIGLRFALENAEQLRRNVGFTLRGVPVGLPRYYVDKLGVELEAQNDIEQWQRYAARIGEKNVSDLVAREREQRALNAEARMKLHKKGVL